MTLKQLKSGKYRVMINGVWGGTTVAADGRFLSGPYLTDEESAIIKEMIK